MPARAVGVIDVGNTLSPSLPWLAVVFALAAAALPPRSSLRMFLFLKDDVDEDDVEDGVRDVEGGTSSRFNLS